jgi:hypothetical protein
MIGFAPSEPVDVRGGEIFRLSSGEGSAPSADATRRSVPSTNGSATTYSLLSSFQIFRSEPNMPDFDARTLSARLFLTRALT